MVALFVFNVLGVATTAYALLQYFVRAREREQAKSERLLLNVLPEPMAARLKQLEGIIADADEDVTVLFADIVGFTPLSERLSASDVVALLDRVFAGWDALAARHRVEKIKTIGDAYMAADWIPLDRLRHRDELRPRGTIEVRGKGLMSPYLLLGRRSDHETPVMRDGVRVGLPVLDSVEVLAVDVGEGGAVAGVAEEQAEYRPDD